LLSALILSLGIILLHSYSLFQKLKREERIKMEIWAQAMQKVIDAPLGADVDLPSQIIIKNRSIPVIKTDSTGKILEVYNLDEIEDDTLSLQKKLRYFKSLNKPIIVKLADEGYQYLYYGNSDLLNKLKWYPVFLVLIFLMFVVIVFLYYYTSKVSEQNLLWAGMAKETAHQIGTPLSSLLGWVELLKADPSSVSVDELQKDIRRLEIISRRFGKIGSQPSLSPADLLEETRQVVRYFKSRLPANIQLEFQEPANKHYQVYLEPELYGWVLENLIKNAVDSMPGGGKISIRLGEEGDYYYVDVKDEGKGIPKNLRSKIFVTGFSTKKRGWGLGLSLAKRIIKDYHQGNIFLKSSVTGKGSIFRLILPKRKKYE